MQKENRADKKQTIFWLLLIYICSVLFRYLMALATRNFPTVAIDEFLYYSLGRSIATEGSLLYLGQPATYNYIVYPLILSPIYLLFGQGTDYFRMIQLWNIILMSLSVFPFYGLCNAMVQKRKTALWLTGLFMLFPCFILGEFIYSESIIYPLFFTLMFCIYRYLKDNEIKYTILIGVLGVLLYYSKPGAVIPALLALILFAGKVIRKKSGKLAIQVLAGFGCLVIGFFVIKLLTEQVFGYQGALLSVYNNQVSFTENFDNSFFFSAAGKFPYYFILAGGILPFMVSLWNFSEYSKEDKSYYILLIICAVLTMIGTAFIVNRPEQKTILYLRYVEMYLPVLLVFVVMPEKDYKRVSHHSRKGNAILCFLILCYVVVCTTVWGSTTGVGSANESHFGISLACLFTKNVMGIANFLIVFLTGVTLYCLVKNMGKQQIEKICCVLLTMLVVVNNIQGYVTTGDNTDKKSEDEVRAILQRLNNQEYIHVYAEDQCDFGLDVNNRYNSCRITENDFLNNIRTNKGFFLPFVPTSRRGMTAVYQTPEVDTIIIDEKISKRIKLSNWSYNFISNNNSFQIGHYSKYERMVDCLLDYNHDSTYTLTVYNDKWLHNPIKLRFEIKSETKQEISIIAGSKYIIEVNKGRNWYEIEINNPVAAYVITVQNDSTLFYDYEITIVKSVV